MYGKNTAYSPRRPNYFWTKRSKNSPPIPRQTHPDDWVAEGCQKYIYETMRPDLIIDMRICRPVAIWRFTVRFLKAKKLIGRKIDKELPVQAYHYRKISLKKIRDYDNCNREINAEISVFLKNAKIPVIKCKNFRQYGKVFAYIENFRPVRPI